MELKQIKELMTAMGRTGTKRIILKKEGFELQLEREDNGKSYDLLPDLEDELNLKAKTALPRSSSSLTKPQELGTLPPPSGPATDSTAIYITSPMVGTFYSTPSPDDPSFVKPGDKVEKTSIVCIIEAMKVMNEIKAGVAGTIVEALVENGHPVEFGTKLFKIS